MDAQFFQNSHLEYAEQRPQRLREAAAKANLIRHVRPDREDINSDRAAPQGQWARKWSPAAVALTFLVLAIAGILFL